jgi:hypothetical protein
VEAQEDYLRREAKLLKREGTPPPPLPPRDLAEAYKTRPLEALGPLKLKPAHEGPVATVKEAGRSIHEIPREELRHTPELPLAPRPLKEGSITQVWVPVHSPEGILLTPLLLVSELRLREVTFPPGVTQLLSGSCESQIWVSPNPQHLHLSGSWPSAQ